MPPAAKPQPVIPNFLIIGVPRSGTTTIYQNLKRHPDVFMSAVKEPMYFICEGEPDPTFGSLIAEPSADWNSYQSLFRNADNAKAVGEASTFYLYSPAACERIFRRLPGVKLIAILRNPVERAYSHFLLNRLRGIEPIADFGRALAAEEDRRRRGWFMYYFYRDVGFYGRQIQRCLDVFPREKILFVLFEEIFRSSDAAVKKICRFLEIADDVPQLFSTRYNASGVPRNRRWHDFLVQPNPVKRILKRFLPESAQYEILTRLTNVSIAKPPMAEAVRRELAGAYREDIRRAADLIQLDLSAWLRGS
jgi:hypothetical protein